MTALATRSLPPERRNAPEQDLAVVVDETQMVADRVVALTLRRPGNEDLPAWDPGAHVDLHLGPGLVRQYCITLQVPPGTSILHADDLLLAGAVGTAGA